VAIGVGLGGAALAQSLRMPTIPYVTRALLVDDDKHQHGKNKNREQEDENDDKDHGRGRRSSTPGAWRGYPAMPSLLLPAARLLLRHALCALCAGGAALFGSPGRSARHAARRAD
jgi:hypothetical protein